MTRVHGQLFSDGRNGLLVVKPSQPFFGVARHERHFDVTDGSIDINLDPTPAGVTYLVAYKEKGDIRKTDFTLRWRVPDRDAYDITPGATQASSTASVVQSATVYERVQLRRAASELGDALEEQVRLESSLLSAQQRISVLEEQLRDFRAVSEEALVDLGDDGIVPPVWREHDERLLIIMQPCRPDLNALDKPPRRKHFKYKTLTYLFMHRRQT